MAFGHIDAYGDYGFCNINDLVDAMADTVHYDEPLQLLIYLICHEADADMSLDTPGCKMEYRAHLYFAFGDAESTLDNP